MNRRGFLGAVAALAVPLPRSLDAPAAPTAVPVARARYSRDGIGYIIGIATETVYVGDFVQIQTRGPRWIDVASSVR